MPPQVLKLVNPLTSLVDGEVLALASVACVARRWHDTFPQPVDRRIEIAHEKVVHMVCPFDVVAESYDSFVTGGAAERPAAEGLIRVVRLTI